MASPINKKPEEKVLNNGYHKFKYNWLRILLTILLFPIVLILSKKHNKEFWYFCQDYQKSGKYLTTDNQNIEFNSLDIYYEDLKNKDLLKYKTNIDQNYAKKINVFSLNYSADKKVSCLIIKNNIVSHKWVIGCHGWTENKFLALRLVDHFLEQGYNILTFDNIAHGESDGEFTDVGYSSNLALDAIVNWIISNENPSEIGLIGNSMGASTVCYYLGTLGYIHNQIKWAVEDCGFANLLMQFRYVIQYRYQKPWWLISYGLANYIKKITNWDVRSYNILSNLSNTKTPILFAHGTADTFVPVFMSKKMYETKIKNEQNKKSKIYLPDGVEHCRIISDCNAEYRNLIYQFIKENT